MDFFVKTKDSDGKLVKVQVSKKIYDVFEEERKREAAYIVYCWRHKDGRDFEALQSCKSLGHECISAEECYFLDEQIGMVRDVLAQCTPTQWERYLLFLKGYNLAQIALLHKCRRQAVQQSIRFVEKRLKLFLVGGLRLG